jgi:hypothetical protein
MNGTESLLLLIAAFDRTEVPYMIVGSYSSNTYIEKWCADHGTLDGLAQAKAATAAAWEDDEAG